MNRFSAFEEISLDGFQIVKAEMFMHIPRKSDPTCTIWPNRISFNKQSLVMLNNCEYVRIEVNLTTKSLIVVPVTSSDKNSLRWINSKKEHSTRNLQSRRFGEEIYKVWKLDSKYNYRTVGRLVSSKNKVMLLFDFNNVETWKTEKPKKYDDKFIGLDAMTVYSVKDNILVIKDEFLDN